MILQQREYPGGLSLVIPCYNEEAVLPLLREELTRFIPSLATQVEVILVDDGSSDRTLPFLLSWASDNPAIKVIVLARNFGHQNAATAGLSMAAGEAVVLMDADLQDPLQVIVQMIEKYGEGYDVVYAHRLTREGEGWFKLASAWLFYRLMKVFVQSRPSAGYGRFQAPVPPVPYRGFVHARVASVPQGMVAWVGFLQTSVPYHRKPRAAGSTKYSLWKMLRFASNAIVSFTPLPLRISLAGGFLIAFAGIIYGLYVAYNTFLYHDTAPGWATQIIFTSVLGGAILVSNGILGEYIGRSFEELKGRPLYVVAHRVNFKDEALNSSS